MTYTPSRNYHVDVVKGLITGTSLRHKFGRKIGVTTAWTLVSSTTLAATQITTATTARVKAGGDANDTAAGSGAREVTIEGLDETGASASEAVATAGVSASSPTTTTFSRVSRAFVSSSGTYAAGNAAAIVVENGAGTSDLLTIDTGEGQTQHAHFTIPLGTTGYLSSVHMSVDSTKAVDFRLFYLSDILDTTAPMKAPRVQLFFDGVTGTVVHDPNAPGNAIPALTDVWMEAFGSAGGDDVSVDFEILLVQD